MKLTSANPNKEWIAFLPKDTCGALPRRHHETRVSFGPLRNHPRHPISLGESQQSKQGGEDYAWPEGASQDSALLADQPECGHPDCDVLRRDHFANDSSRGIGCCQKHWAKMQLLGCSDLQVAEQEVARRVASAQETRNPSQVTAGDGKRGTDVRHCRPQRIRHS